MGVTPPRAIGCFVGLLLLAGAASAGQAPRGQVPPPAASAPGVVPPSRPLLGDQTDGSRARPVHRIPLRDVAGGVVRTTGEPPLSFSSTGTCGADCHDVSIIGKGWHFNVAAEGSARARPGEPWILVDADAATALPLSYHSWPGTFHPEQVGITSWAFARMFGGRTPGGLSGGREPSPDLERRWAVSGPLEPNCLACHDQSPAYDHAEYGRQVGLENFRRAVAAASGMAQVTGAKVVFDVVREVPARRCYFCHSNADLEHTGQGRWAADGDIHMARGMTCVDCHRNGLDHSMTRGYEGDPSGDRAVATAVTCRGCHLASEPERVFARGRLGAPYPRHAGLPPVHLTKLACTACHAGPRPGASMRRLKTSLAHGLGGPAAAKAGDALPHLMYPVFATGADGATAPNRLLWPAFWGRLSRDAVRPIAPERIKRQMEKAGVRLERALDGSWPRLDEAMLATVLEALAAEAGGEGEPVYVAGGKLYRLGDPGRVRAESHAAARPYLWPIAHDVRPAALALGARGCEDCHDQEAPIFFGRVPVDSPLGSARGESWAMSDFQKNLDVAHAATLARTFRYRPYLKASLVAAVVVLSLVSAVYLFAALGAVSAAIGRGPWLRALTVSAAVISCAGSVASAWPALVFGGPLSGTRLMVHVTVGPVLAACLALVAAFWAHQNRLSRDRGAGAEWTGWRWWVIGVGRLAFWVAVMAAVPVVVTATLPMSRAFASIWQPALFLAHRWAAVTLAASLVVFLAIAIGVARGFGAARGFPGPREVEGSPEA